MLLCTTSAALTGSLVLFCFFPDSCMPLNFTNQMSHDDHKARGATLPRMGSGQGRARRGSAGTHRVRDGATEQRESQEMDKVPPGAKGNNNNRQHSGTGRGYTVTQMFLVLYPLNVFTPHTGFPPVCYNPGGPPGFNCAPTSLSIAYFFKTF